MAAGLRKALWAATWATCIGHGEARPACDENPFPDVRRSIVGEHLWVRGMSLSIADLTSIDAAEAGQRFADHWRRANQPVRANRAGGVSVLSALKGGCLYSLQMPPDDGGGLPARLAVTDLRRPVPSLPSSFEWPPAVEGDVLTDTVSEDGSRLSRLLSYRVEKTAVLAAQECMQRLHRGDWKLDGVTLINDQNVVFHGRKHGVGVDVAVTKDGTGAVVTLNFAQTDV